MGLLATILPFPQSVLQGSVLWGPNTEASSSPNMKGFKAEGLFLQLKWGRPSPEVRDFHETTHVVGYVT